MNLFRTTAQNGVILNILAGACGSGEDAGRWKNRQKYMSVRTVGILVGLQHQPLRERLQTLSGCDMQVGTGGKS
jgi:hypothetical protein